MKQKMGEYKAFIKSSRTTNVEPSLCVRGQNFLANNELRNSGEGFTLAEGATHTNMLQRVGNGFTLAEVLITLAIIGVVLLGILSFD